MSAVPFETDRLQIRQTRERVRKRFLSAKLEKQPQKGAGFYDLEDATMAKGGRGGSSSKGGGRGSKGGGSKSSGGGAKGGGGRAGWPSTTGRPSGGGRDNAPPKK